MKPIRLFFLMVLLSITGSLCAAYLEYVPQKITQPDGKIVNCFASGDEYYHWLHDANGFTIIQNPLTGFFVYADKTGDDLIPTNLIPGVDDPSRAGLKAGVNISDAKYREYFAGRFKEPATKSTRSYSNTGEFNNLVVFVRFSNQNEYTEPLTQYSTQFNSTGTVSMTEYFKEVSKSQLIINTTFYPTTTNTSIVSYQDSHSRKYYQRYSGTNPDGYRTDNEATAREMTLLKSASEFVSAQVVASGIDYDHNNDGNIDNVCFIIQGPTDGWSDLLWPHRWVLYTYDVRIGGKRVYDFNFQLSEALGVSVLCHEMFHSLGAPDLYRYVNDDITPVGPWDLMAHNKTPPQHMSAYMKMKYGQWFSQIPSITTDGTYSLKPLAADGFAAYKIASPNSTSEYFVVEYRKAAGRFESSVVGSGLIIYRVNPSLDGNAQGPPDEVYVYRQNGTSRSNGNINNATFSSSVGRTEFGDNTAPSDFLSNGTAGGIRISNIGPIGETISFTVGTGGALNPPRELTANLSGRNVTLTWLKPETGSGTLSGYKVYRNGAAMTTINNPNTLTFSESNLADGNYQYHVTARYTSPTGESAPSNTVTVSVSAEARPDLVIINPAVDPGNVEPGGLVKLTCKLENQGTAGAGASMLRIYLSQDDKFDSGDRQLASGTMDALDAGASRDVSGENIQIPASTNVGKWFVLFLADADGAVAESIENNNQASIELTVGNPALNPPRNLVAQVSASTVKLSWTEPEAGGGTLAGYYVYRNGSNISTIGNPATLEFTDSGLALGVYTYYLTAFYSAPVGVSSKSNEVTVTLSNDAKPDLTAQDLLVTPVQVAPGGSLDISCSVLNIGGAVAGTNEVRLYLS
ncbi:MAG: M6 family metalloprotease domain-containing protein, partial [Bacteroidales bacterium]